MGRFVHKRKKLRCWSQDLTDVQTPTNTSEQQVIGAAHLMMRQAGVSQPKGLFTWGYNSSGELGLGDTSDRSSPCQIGSDTNWSTAAAGDYFSLAIRTTGTLWSWGGSTGGVLGQGNLTYYSSPLQVGSGTNWSKVSAICNNSSSANRV